jgi:hypothetical protein
MAVLDLNFNDACSWLEERLHGPEAQNGETGGTRGNGAATDAAKAPNGGGDGISGNEGATGDGHEQPTAKASSPAGKGWPVLSEDAYYGLAGEIVKTILPQTEADPAALLLQLLVTFGNMVGRKPYILWASTKHYAILFTLIIGRSARSRKGTSGDNIRAVIELVDPNYARDNIKSGVSSGEGIIEKIRDASHEWDKKSQSLVIKDPGVADKRLLLDEREFSSALTK